MGFLWGILACAVVGTAAWWYGRRKAIDDMENRALTLLQRISDLIQEENTAKAQSIIKRFTSGEARIRDILIFESLE